MHAPRGILPSGSGSGANYAEKAKPFSFVTRNIRGLAQKIHTLLALGHDVLALQETDVAECDVVWLRAQASAGGYTLLFADSINMATGEGMKMGRRAALLCKGPAVPAVIAPPSDATCQSLLATGRWVEALIPVGDGLGHIIVASAYGYSGASSANAEYVKNETLITNMVVRLNHNPKIPYVVGADLNVDPLDFKFWRWPSRTTWSTTCRATGFLAACRLRPSSRTTSMREWRGARALTPS